MIFHLILIFKKKHKDNLSYPYVSGSYYIIGLFSETS